ncbi:MAG: YraN family protein [Bacteroidales bacterium]
MKYLRSRIVKKRGLFLGGGNTMEERLCGLTKPEVGKRGEDLALAYVLQMGLKFVARNWHYGHAELDLVAEDHSFIHFIEVRTLVYPNKIEPFETINTFKQRHIIKAARAFVAKYGINKEVVFDVVSVVLNGENYKLEYIKNAFTPLWG